MPLSLIPLSGSPVGYNGMEGYCDSLSTGRPSAVSENGWYAQQPLLFTLQTS